MNQCTICAEKDQDNADEDIRYVIVWNGTDSIVRRCYMCATHRQWFLDHGYEVS